MTQKLFLTSAVALSFVAPAIAEPSHTDTFPSGGLMQADYTYTNAATETNMGVYEGTVNADAQYEDVLYQIAVGKYLPANSETTIDCDQNGYFCAGDNNGVYYSSSAQGLTQCPTGYGNTANGASANTDCYRLCTNADVEHSTGTMNGGYYYGDNNQCEPTDCVNGWHLKTILANYINTSPSNRYYETNDQESYDYGQNKGNFDLEDGEFIAVFPDGNMIKGKALPSVTQGINDVTIGSPDEANTGNNCWCKLTEYITPYAIYPISTSYVYTERGDFSSCANNCVHYRQYGSNFFQLWVDTTVGGPSSCEANTITINWGDTDAADVTANEAGTATYGSDIRTPVKAQTKAGKRFTGWRFSAPQQTQLP